MIDLHGAFKLTTVVSVYSAAAYESEAWNSVLKSSHPKSNRSHPKHWKAHVGVTANDGRVKMIACKPWIDMIFCGHEPKRFGWEQSEPKMLPALGPLGNLRTWKTLGMGVHETWTRPENTNGAWTVKDLCEIVLCRYREKRTDKPGSWFSGARARVTVDDEAPEYIPSLLKLSQYTGNPNLGAWAIVDASE